MPYLVYTLLTLVAVAVFVRYYWSKVRRRFARVSDGMYRSGALPKDMLRRVVKRYGLRTVIDFRGRQTVIHAERDALAELGVTHVSLPTSQHPTPADGARFLKVIERAERPVLIHCSHGAGRAPHMAALYLSEQTDVGRAGALSTSCWPSPRMRRRVNEFLDEFEAARRAPRVAAAGISQPTSARRGEADGAVRDRQRYTYHDWLCICVLVIVCIVWLRAGRSSSPVTHAGVLIIGVSAAWRTWCSGFARPGRTFVPRGPYALARHPLHIGTVLHLGGAALLVPLSWPVRAVVVGLVVVVSEWRARVEDRKLVRRLNETQLEWTATTGAVWPSPRSLAAIGRDRTLLRGFKWRRVRSNGGRSAALVLVPALVLLWGRIEWGEMSDLPLSRILADDIILEAMVVIGAFLTGLVLANSRASEEIAPEIDDDGPSPTPVPAPEQTNEASSPAPWAADRTASTQ